MYVGSRTLATHLDYAPDEETILRYAAQALERPRDAAFWDDTLYSTHTLGFYWAPDSDDLISQSNYRCVLEDLSTAYARYPGAIDTASISHWTYSHFNCIRIRVLYSNGEIHPAFADAVAIWEALEGYPLYSEDDHSELETEEWDRAISEAVNYASEDAETPWSEVKRERVQNLLWESCPGYYDVGYVPDEALEDAERQADAEIAAIVATGLPEHLAGEDRYGEPISGL